jgi:hypothetical protein
MQILKRLQQLPLNRNAQRWPSTLLCFIVVDEVADEFIALFANKINLLKQGDPMMEGINWGLLLDWI